MENKDPNHQLKEEISTRFETLFRRIGNNRQQLANKVIAVRHDLFRQLNKDKVDVKGSQAILREMSALERMAAKQLPHQDHEPVREPHPTPAPAEPATPKTPAAAKRNAPAKKPAAAVKKKKK